MTVCIGGLPRLMSYCHVSERLALRFPKLTFTRFQMRLLRLQTALPVISRALNESVGGLFAALNGSRQPRFGGPASPEHDTAPWSAGRCTALSGVAGEPLSRLMVRREGVSPFPGCVPGLERHRTEPIHTSCQIIHLIPSHATAAGRAAAVALSATAVPAPQIARPIPAVTTM